MTISELPPAVVHLVLHHVPSMDHVALLLALRDGPEGAQTAASLAAAARLDGAVTDRALRDLVASRLAARDAEGFHYAPAADIRDAAEELIAMYHSKPVTLVRAIYARPTRAAQVFADAFRLRKTED